MSHTQLMPANDRVSIELGEDGVAHVRLIRADKMNALDPEMFAAIIEAGTILQRTKGVRVVVLSGEGRAFVLALIPRVFRAPPAKASRLCPNAHTAIPTVHRKRR